MMTYTNPEYAFRFKFDSDAWAIKETLYYKTMLVELTCRYSPGVNIAIKGAFNLHNKVSLKELVEQNIEELRTAFEDFAIHSELYHVTKFSKKKYHDLKFDVNGIRCRRLLFIISHFIYIVSLTARPHMIDLFENALLEIIRTLRFNIRKKNLYHQEYSFQIIPHIFNISFDGVNLLLGDIALKSRENTIVNMIEFRCFDSSGQIIKDIFHQSEELVLFGRQATSQYTYPFTNIILNGRTLNLLLPHEIISGASIIDRIKISVYGRTENGLAFVKTCLLKIPQYAVRDLVFPLIGKWQVMNGPGLYGIHRGAFTYMHGKLFSSQRFAIDLVKVDQHLRRFRNKGNKNDEYLSFGESVYSPSNGTIIKAVSEIADNIPGDVNPENLEGNHIIIKCGSRRYILLAHLKKDSIKVKAGDQIKEGSIVAKVGNSGNSTEPHLHIHMANGKDIMMSQGLPMLFKQKPFLLNGDLTTTIMQ